MSIIQKLQTLNITSYTVDHTPTILYVREGEPTAAEMAATAAADFDAKVAAAVATQTAGLKAKNEELLGKVKSAAATAKLFEGLDPVELAALKVRLDTNEDAKLFAEGKGESVIEKYTGRMRESHTQALAEKDILIKAQSDRADAYRGSVLDNQIRSVTAGLHKGAVEDALLHARTIFSLDAKGNAVQLDADGRAVLGKDGATPFSPAEWIEKQKELKPHWFPMGTSGAGTGITRDSNGTGKSIKRADFDKLTGADQAAQARSGVKITD